MDVTYSSEKWIDFIFNVQFSNMQYLDAKSRKINVFVAL
jgi:hypothetical protein